MAVPLSMLGLWGYLFGVGQLSYDGWTEVAPKAIRLNADGECPLFDGLQSCIRVEHRDLWALISDLRATVLFEENYTDDMRMVFVHERLHGFFVRHPSALEECADVKLLNGLTIGRFVQSAKLFKRMRTLGKVIGGEETLLVEDLEALLRVENLDDTFRDQLRMMVENLREYFAGETQIFKRLAFIHSQTEELLNPDENGVYVEIDLGSWGSFDDLLRCYGFYKHRGWHWWAVDEQTPHCSAASTLIRLRPDNSTRLTDALEASWRSWTVKNHRADFKGYLQRIKNLARGAEVGMTAAQRMVQMATVINGFTPVPSRHQQMMSIWIPGWGTVGEFCECVGVLTK